MSTEVEKGLPLALLAKASDKGSLDPSKRGSNKKGICSLYQEMRELHRLGTAVRYVM
jgi:hypothetical protein